MNEFLQPEAEEALHSREFRVYLAEEFGITDRADQDRFLERFRASALVNARKFGLLPPGDPIEDLRQELIMEGVTDPEEQKPILQEFIRNHTDPPFKTD